MSARDPESLRHELDYLVLFLTDLGSINEGIVEVGRALSDATTEVALLGISASVLQSAPSAEPALHALSQAMTNTRGLQAALDNLIALATGRVKALERERQAPHEAEPE